MKLLITGASGFIGHHLVKRLTESNHEVSLIVRPGSNVNPPSNKIKTFVFEGDLALLTEWMQKQKFDGVIHLASLFLAQHKPEDVKNLIDSNVGFATGILDASVSSGVPWFINTGTFWQHYESQSYAPVNLYAATKQAFESIAKYYYDTQPINFVTLKLNDTFGPEDSRPKIFNLWHKISLTNESIDMSPGEQLIDISFIDNVIDAYEKLIEAVTQDTKRTLTGKSFAVLSPERMSLKQLASVFEKASGKKLHINWGKREYRPREVMIPWENGSVVPGWKPAVSIEEGIRRTFHEK